MSFYSKQAESEALQSEVERFLASGGQIKKLDCGFTNFPDGVLPKSNERQIDPKKMEQEKEKKIAEKNKLVREQNRSAQLQKEKQAAKDREQAEKRRKQIIRENLLKEQIAALSDFSEKAARGDLARLAKMCGVSTKTLQNARIGYSKIADSRWNKIKEVIGSFEFGSRIQDKELAKKIHNEQKRFLYAKKNPPSEETLRRKEVLKRRKEAEERGDKIFTAPCAKHGMTSYRIYENGSRCLECRLKMNKKYLEPKLDGIQKDRKERKDHNTAMMKKALADSKMEFQGLCRKCGHTRFKIFAQVGKKESHGYRCAACAIEAVNRYNQKRRKKCA